MALPDLLVGGYGIVSMDVSVDGRVDVSVIWGHGDGYCAMTMIRIGMGIASNVSMDLMSTSNIRSWGLEMKSNHITSKSSIIAI